MDDLRGALHDAICVADKERPLTHYTRAAILDDFLLPALRAYAARPDVVERCARAIAGYGTSHFGDDTPLEQQDQTTRAMRLGEAKAALAAFLGEET